MAQSLTELPRLRQPAILNAAEYWLAPERFARHCQPLGDRFLVAMQGLGEWLCLTDPDDIKGVFTADTDVLRLGAALAKGSAHPLVLGPTGLTNVDGPEHMRRRRMQLPPFHGQALGSYQDVMQRKTEETLARWPYGRATRSDVHMQAISLEVIIAVVFGVTDPDRVERLRAATLALMREGNSQALLPADDDREHPRERLGPALPTHPPPDGRGRRDRARRGRRTPRRRQHRPGRRPRDVPARPRRGRHPDARWRAVRRDAHPAARRPRDHRLHPRLDPRARHPPPRRARAPPGSRARRRRRLHRRRHQRGDAPAPRVPDHRAARHRTIRATGGLTIPARTLVIVHITLVHRRPDLYPDPLAFRPQRFLDTRAGTYTWIPFGGGPRRCLGAAFSLIETRIVLRTILRHAHLMPTTKRPERTARHTITIVPAHGGTITLTRRRPTTHPHHHPADPIRASA